MIAAAEAADTGAGVFIKNCQGDLMDFEMAHEMGGGTSAQFSPTTMSQC
jgi:hypothetical protein